MSPIGRPEVAQRFLLWQHVGIGRDPLSGNRDRYPGRSSGGGQLLLPSGHVGITARRAPLERLSADASGSQVRRQVTVFPLRPSCIASCLRTLAADTPRLPHAVQHDSDVPERSVQSIHPTAAPDRL